MAAKVTYLDSGAVIALARYGSTVGERVAAIVSDEDRLMATSLMVELEVVPQATWNRQVEELETYREFFSGTAIRVPLDPQCLAQALALGCKYGINGADAIHAAAALRAGAAELVTSEKPTRPLFRLAAEGLTVTSLWTAEEADSSQPGA